MDNVKYVFERFKTECSKSFHFACELTKMSSKQRRKKKQATVKQLSYDF